MLRLLKVLQEERDWVGRVWNKKRFGIQDSRSLF